MDGKSGKACTIDPFSSSPTLQRYSFCCCLQAPKSIEDDMNTQNTKHTLSNLIARFLGQKKVAKRKRVSPLPRRNALRFEPLEDRTMLAIVDNFAAGVLTFTGDGANDQLSITALNQAGTSLQYDIGGGLVTRNGVVSVAFDGMGGTNTFAIIGSATANNSINVLPNTGAGVDQIQFSGLPMTTQNVSTITIDSSGNQNSGVDFVNVQPINVTVDTVTLQKFNVSYVSTTRTVNVLNTADVSVTVQTNDTVNYVGTAESETFDAFTTLTQLSSTTYRNGTIGQGITTATAGAGGVDIAALRDSAAADMFTAYPTWASLTGAGINTTVMGFDQVYAFAINGGIDSAVFVDSAGNDQFAASPVVATMSGTFLNQTNNFENNYAFRTGGNDSVVLVGGAGDDVFFGLTSFTAMTVPGVYVNQAIGFTSTSASAGAGANNQALLYDSAGDDTFTASPTTAVMSGSGVTNLADAFDFVFAIGSTGNDTASLTDSAGNDSFVGSASDSYLQSAGVFFNRVFNFDSVTATASTGNDIATFFDSPGDDSITAAGNSAILVTGTPMATITATGFDGVLAIKAAGGTDVETINAPNFVYGSIGGFLAASTVLVGSEVNTLLQRAAAASASNDGIIAIVDRNGRILGVRTESGINTADPTYLVYAVDGAVSKARTAAFFSSNQAPLTSRTVRNISQTTITEREVNSNPSITDPNSTLRGPGFVAPIGVGGHFPPEVDHTPLVDLFNIEHTNRDSLNTPGADRIAGTADDIAIATRFNVNPAFVPAGQELFAPVSYGVASGLNVNAQSRGIATLPGGIPIYKNGNLVGGIGVFFPGPTGAASFEQGFVANVNQTELQRTNASRVLESEWVALAAIGGSSMAGAQVGAIAGIQPVAGIDLPFGLIYLVGIALEGVGPTAGIEGINQLIQFSAGLGTGNPNSGANQSVNTMGGTLMNGRPVAEGWLVNPHNAADNSITLADVQTIVQSGINQANATRAAIRFGAISPAAVPGSATTRMVFTVTDKSGEVLGQYRMPDATVFSIDVATAKARNVAYYNDPAALNAPDALPGIPSGTAFTARTFRFVTGPRYPTGAANGTPPGFFSILNAPGINPLTAENTGAALAANVYDNTVSGYDSFHIGTNFRDPSNTTNQNGIVFFPGSSGVYKGGVLVGGFGVSGDGVDQDDVVTSAGQANFLPPDAIRADMFIFRDVRLPYQKFNRNPIAPGAQ